MLCSKTLFSTCSIRRYSQQTNTKGRSELLRRPWWIVRSFNLSQEKYWNIWKHERRAHSTREDRFLYQFLICSKLWQTPFKLRTRVLASDTSKLPHQRWHTVLTMMPLMLEYAYFNCRSFRKVRKIIGTEYHSREAKNSNTIQRVDPWRRFAAYEN